MLAEIIPKLAAMEQEETRLYYPRPSLASPALPDDPGRCIRALTYARTGIPPAPWPGRFLLVLDDSSWHAELTLDWLRKSSYRIHSQELAVDLPLPRPIGRGGYCSRCQLAIPNTVLHGHIDALLTDLLGVDRLLELKSISHFGFEEVLKGEPSLDHLTQTCIYLAGVNVTFRVGISQAVLLYKNKNTAAYAEFVLTYDQNTDRCHVLTFTASEGIHQELNRTYEGLVTNALAKFALVEQHATANQLPQRPYRSDHWRCGYCPWSRVCWDGYVNEVAARETTVTLPEDLHPLVHTYAEAAALKGRNETITKRLRPQLLAAMEAANAKTATAGAHTLTVTAQERVSLDESQIPPDIRTAAEVSKIVETLRVSAATRQTTTDTSPDLPTPNE